jgi:dTDP-4-dehydrorhamnose 3,5-epimerase
VTKEYSPQHERCIKWDDPEIGVQRPVKENAILSVRDKKCPPLGKAETNFEY